MIKFVFWEQPIAKTRHRSYIQGKHIKSYDTQVADKNKIRWQLKEDMNKEKLSMLEDYLSVSIDFYFMAPQSYSAIKRNSLIWFEYPTVSDLDNLAKFYLDCCNDIVFSDDRQIVELKCRKFYSKTPHVEINIMAKHITVEKEVGTILGLYGQEELINFFEIAVELCELYSIDESFDWVKDELKTNDDDEVRVVRLTRTAYLLSKLAFNHANLLKTIERKCPGFWQKAERLARLEMQNE